MRERKTQVRERKWEETSAGRAQLCHPRILSRGASGAKGGGVEKNPLIKDAFKRNTSKQNKRGEQKKEQASFRLWGKTECCGVETYFAWGKQHRSRERGIADLV